MKQSIVRRALHLAAIAPVVAASPYALAQDDAAETKSESIPFLRTVEDAGVVTLEVASREFVSKDGQGPKVWLVGVAHVADSALYQSHQELLADFDVVLFESVMPGGLNTNAVLKPEEKPGATQERMKFLGSVIERYHADHGVYPDNLDQLSELVAKTDTRLVSILPGTKNDAWGKGIAYSSSDEGASYTLLSLGADGKPGGEDAAADLTITNRDDIAPMSTSSEGGLQSELANTLGLAFQLTALSYAEPNFRCSDMTMTQLAQAMSDRDLDVSDLEGALDATSLPAQLMKMLLRFVKMADEMLGGAIADICRLALIEILGNENMTQQAMQQFGEGFGDVIIGDRNQVVIDDLKRIIDNEDDVKSVAIYYGAAHMHDFVERLEEQLGYEPSGEAKWFTGMRVDMNNSSMPRDQLEMTRNMLRKTMAQQMKALNKK